MKRVIATLLLLVAAIAAPAQSTTKEKQHKAALEIVLSNATTHQNAGCSATAIGPHTLLTAQHCDVENAIVYFNQNQKPFANGRVIAEKYYDNNDHMLLVIPSVEFKHFITYNASKVRRIQQGEHLYFWGNPSLIMNQYREVYAMGVFPGKSYEGINAYGEFEMVSGPVVGGDSGSAIFSTEDGQLVGITTWGLADGLILGSYPLQFTQDQIDQATGVGSITFLPDTRPQVIVNIAPSRQIERGMVCSVPSPKALLIIEFSVSGLFILALLVILGKIAVMLYPGISKTVRHAGRFSRFVFQSFIKEISKAKAELRKI